MLHASRPHVSPGRLVYWLYHRPKTWLQDSRDRASGRRGEAAMRLAARHLAVSGLGEWGLHGPPCRFLTGAAFLHQTVFCARSFEWACGTRLRLELFDDGTLGGDGLAQLGQALPGAFIGDPAAVVARLDRTLPPGRFPLLRRMRETDPRMRKLLDLHAGLQGPSLYLDSDMLFFAEPRTLRQWLTRPTGELYMAQAGDALVGDRDRLSRILGVDLAPGVNTGIVALHDELLDWAELERAASRLTAQERAHPWAEQTLFAAHLSRRGAQPLPRADYVLCHGREDLRSDPPPLRHYVHKAKALYAGGEWRRWLERSRLGPAGRG